MCVVPYADPGSHRVSGCCHYPPQNRSEIEGVTGRCDLSMFASLVSVESRSDTNTCIFIHEVIELCSSLSNESSGGCPALQMTDNVQRFGESVFIRILTLGAKLSGSCSFLCFIQYFKHKICIFLVPKKPKGSFWREDVHISQ